MARRRASKKIKKRTGVKLKASDYVGLPKKLENVSTANALQLKAGRRRSVPVSFYASPVASLKSLSLSAAVLERI